MSSSISLKYILSSRIPYEFLCYVRLDMLMSEFLVLRLNSLATTNNLVSSGKDNIHKQLSMLRSRYSVLCLNSFPVSYDCV